MLTHSLEAADTLVPPNAPAARPTTTPSRAPARLIPGLALASAAALVSLVASRLVPGVNALLVAIVLGVVAGNVRVLPASTAPGLAVASRRLLRLGIVLLGLQVSLAQIADLGLGVVAVAVGVVAGGFLVAEVAGRLLRVRPSQRILIGAGMSICGAAAVAAVEGVARQHEPERDIDEQVVTAVALVVALGTAMIGIVPLVSGALGLDERTAGLWAGASIHEVAQVVATGGIIGGAALQAAVVLKLTRVLMLAPVVAILTLGVRRTGAGRSTGETRTPLVPLFVLGFLGAVLLRSLGVVPPAALGVATGVQTFLFGAAMFALGCGVRPAALRAVGMRPILLALLTTLTVAGAGLVGVLVVS